MRKIFLVVAVFSAILICASCSPEQTQGTIHIEGDSLTFDTYWGTGLTAPFTSGEFAAGSSADFNPWGTPASVRLPQAVQAGEVDTLVWALGLNDISRAGGTWSPESQLIWYDLLVNITPAESCIVMIKPWVLNFDGRPVEQMNALRDWIDWLAANRPNTVVEDWKPLFEANPQWAMADGVHILPDQGGPEARDAMYRQGVDRCGR